VAGRLHLDRTDAMLALLVVIWGAAFPGLKVLGTALDPYQMTWYRYALFPVAYGTWMALRRRDTFRTVSGGDWLAMGLLGIVGVLGYHFTLNWGLEGAGGVSAATGAILVATTPLFTLLLSVATGRERPTAMAWLGSLLAFAGVAIVVFLGKGRVDVDVAVKALVVLIAPLSWAVYSVYTRPLVHRYGGLFTTGATLSVGALVLVPLGIHYGVAPLRQLSALQWFWLGWLAFLSTILGYAMWNNALKHRTATQVSVYVYFNPVVAALVGVTFLHEHLTGWFLAGSALVLGGVILVNQARVKAANLAAAQAATAVPAPTKP
jgi:drug/metabolite transporter (DMT)-like permease